MGLGAGRWIVVPGKREQMAQKAFARAQQRRLIILTGLCVIAFASGIWALIKGGAAIEIHLVADAAAAFYVALLLDAKRRRAERILKVRALAQRERKHAPAYEGEPVFEALEAGGSGRS